MSAELNSSPERTGYAVLRRAMVDNQLRTFNITDRSVLDRMQSVPRENFLPPEQAAIAYSDRALTLTEGNESRRMLAPMILARMIQAAAISPADRILDVGGAAGYSAAVLAGLGAEVVALESDLAMTRKAEANLKNAGIRNVRAVCGPLEAGLAEAGPFDVIIVNGMIETVPDRLLAQLADGGRLVAVRRTSNDPTGRAGKAVQYEKSGQAVGVKEIFDTSAPVLPGFQAARSFAL